MKIAMLGLRGIPSSYSGVETSVEELAVRLVMKGHEVTVYCPVSSFPQSSYKGVLLAKVPCIRTPYMETMTGALFSALDTLKRKYDIVHLHCLGPAFYSWLPRIRKMRTVVTIHSLNWKHSKWNSIARSFLKFCEFPAVTWSDRTIVVSASMKRYYQDKYPRRKVLFVPNGISQAKLCEPAKLKSLGLKKRQYLLFVGRLSPEKGAHFLLKAYQEIKTAFPLVIAGDLNRYPDYSQKLTALGDSRVLFLGQLNKDELSELYSSAYLFVLPSISEGMSIALLEAMSFGLCPIVSDIEENVDVVGDFGYFFPSGNTQALRELLERLLRSPEEVAEKSKDVRKYVDKTYNWDVITDRVENIYLNLMGRSWIETKSDHSRQ
jgi:glycosyltransferase involved in cell wall biosynthesis